jgi:NADPH:quinone reductase-like Zn-dependent oxidoreductase
VPLPSLKKNELLIRIRATTVTAGDCELRGLSFSLGLRLLVRLLMGLIKPRRKILGQELAGEVVRVGSAVTRFRPADKVFGTTGFRFGAYAEYICLPEDPKGGAIAAMPTNMTFEEAAAVPTGGLEALHFLRRGGNLLGRSVLINGAGGGIGMYAVQLAKFFGARVTGVDGPEKQDLMRSIGADRVIDYTREDFTRRGETYDVIFDVVGTSSFSGSVAALSDQGHYLLGNPGLSSMVRGLWTSMSGRKKVVFGAAKQESQDLVYLKRLIEGGRVRTIVDRRYPLDQVPAAHRTFETGHLRGRIVISVNPGP